MTRLVYILTVNVSLMLVVLSASNLHGRQLPTRDPKPFARAPATKEPATRPAYQRAFVIDDRLSALRRQPGVQSEVIHRLRLGRVVYVVGASSGAGHTRFCRVAVTRRTRGWIHPSALAVQGRAGEDQRIVKLIETASDGLDRIGLCRILVERFGQSRLVPRALLTLGEEADRAAETLTQRARKRLAEVQAGNATTLSDYYLNDAGLDRYSKLRIVFDFNESMSEFVYDGRAYRDVVRRFPDREEATIARKRLELAGRKMAQR